LPPSWHVCPLPGSQQFLTGNWKPSICYSCSCCVCVIGKRRHQHSWEMFLITIWVCYLVLLYFRIGLDELFPETSCGKTDSFNSCQFLYLQFEYEIRSRKCIDTDERTNERVQGKLFPTIYRRPTVSNFPLLKSGPTKK
jgi:hypothetical protein